MKYQGSKLEFIALIWSICEHFRDYLFYADHFDKYTDFNPLMYLKSSCKLNATSQRWINETADYHFSIYYKPGTENKVADSLSRFPIQSLTDLSEYKEVIHDEEIKAVFNGSINQSKNGESWIPEVNKVKCSIDGDETQFLYDAGKSPHIINCYEIVMAQDEEKICIKVVKDMLAEKAGLRKADRQQLLHETCVLLRDYQNLSVDDKGLLYRKISPKKQKQLVLPLKFKPLVSSKLHVKIGQLGVGRSMQLIKDRFYWPGMGFDISHFVTKTCFCVKKKKQLK